MKKDTADYVVCKECNKKLKQINNFHLDFCSGNCKNLTEYKIKYPDAKIICENTRKYRIEQGLKSHFKKGHTIGIETRNKPGYTKGEDGLYKPRLETIFQARCACGCNEITNPGYRFIKGHQSRGRASWIKGLTKDMDLRVKKSADTMKRRMATGEIKPSTPKGSKRKEIFGDAKAEEWGKNISIGKIDWDFYNKYGYLKGQYPYCNIFNDGFKDKIRALYDNKCVVTGMDQKEHIRRFGEKLIAHHWTYDKDETTPFYFVPVTRKINSLANSNKSEWIEMFNGIAEDKYCELMQ